MQLILPDVLAAGRGLSPGASGFLILVGILLWAVGWRWHRFWVVFGITLGAGLIGLNAGQAAGGQVMVVGVLLAVAAGMLALELARILAFVTGGCAAWAAAQSVFPQAQELWAVFLSGGLLGVVLYQLWTMLTTSLIGVLTTWHATLVLAEQFAVFDSAKWAGQNTAALNGGVLTAVVLGVLIQARTAQAKETAEDEEKVEKKPKKDNHHHHEEAEEPEKKGSGWLRRMTGKKAA